MTQEMRLECLKLALNVYDPVTKSTLARARAFAKFVEGPVVRVSKASTKSSVSQVSANGAYVLSEQQQ